MPLERLFIVTGDVSGDIHAARVVDKLGSLNTALDIQAIGGEQLTKRNITLFHDQRHQMGVLGPAIISKIPFHLQLGYRLLHYFKTQWRPDTVLLIDYGMFNLWLAKRLKAIGIKTVYYIPPQIWATRRYRIKAIQRYVDQVLCIFPFEHEFYQRYNVPSQYVGHPLVEELPDTPERSVFCQRHGLDPDRPIVGLFPGSRKMELEFLLNPMIQALPLIHYQHPDVQFVLAQSSAMPAEQFQSVYQSVNALAERHQVRLVRGENYALLGLSQAILSASGTVTLEAALYGTPSVISYRLPAWAFEIIKRLKDVDDIGLPNLLSDQPERILPELWMEQATPQGYAKAIEPFLSDPQHITETLTHLNHIRAKLGATSASTQVAQCLLDV